MVIRLIHWGMVGFQELIYPKSHIYIKIQNAMDLSGNLDLMVPPLMAVQRFLQKMSRLSRGL